MVLAAPQRASGRIGLHGMKARWSPVVLSEGLIRPSAAWFMLDDGGLRLDRTMAAAAYLALGMTTCERLAPLSCPGAYTRFFAEQTAMLPAAVRFEDAPTGAEIAHRYLWLGEPSGGTTAPYTKVARAGRQVTVLTGHHVTVTSLALVQRIEQEVDHESLPPGPARLIERVAVDASTNPIPARDTKLARFCWSIGQAWRSALDIWPPVRLYGVTGGTR